MHAVPKKGATMKLRECSDFQNSYNSAANDNCQQAGVPLKKNPANDNERELCSTSLLRYPGGKTRAVSAIISYFPEGITEMVSPFFGGGSIEIYMASRGINVKGYDVFKHLAEFWQSVQQKPEKVASEVQGHYPLTREKFYKLQDNLDLLETKYCRAAAYYAINRASFSGCTLSGGMSPMHPRFTLSAINRLRNFYNPNFSVKEAGFEESIGKHKTEFMYLDPPYLIRNVLYGRNGDAHRNFNHERLASLITERGNWIMSYNDCDEIRRLYKAHRKVRLNWRYGMSKDKKSNEILIFSKDYSGVVTRPGFEESSV